MNLSEAAARGLAAGILVAALAVPADRADARVIAYSSLQISDFKIIGGSNLVDDVDFANTTTSAASLDETSVSAAVNNVAGNADVAMSCLGQCDGIDENHYSRHSDIDHSVSFARGDAQLTGSLLTSANGRTVGETQLVDTYQSSASGMIQSVGNFWTIDFTVEESGDLSLTFNALGELTAFSDEAGGVAASDFDFNIKLRNMTTGLLLPIIIASTHSGNDLSSLNNSIAAFGIDSQSYKVEDMFLLTVSGLQAGTRYNLQISHNSDVSARSARKIAAPASMGLLGLGLIGVAGLGRRRMTM